MNHSVSTTSSCVTLGRTGIISTRLALGCAIWPLVCTYDCVVEVFRTAFQVGIRHLDIAPLYGTEEIVGRALKDAEAPKDVVLATKVCAYKDDLGIAYREYSDRTVYRSVERSLKRLQVHHLPIVHIHDCEAQDLEWVFAKDGALRALLDLKDQGVVGSVGMATFCLKSLEKAIDCGDVDLIQSYHACTLLNQEAKEKVIPAARTRNISFINAAPFAGHILATGAVPEARYNYRPADPILIKAVQRLEEICTRKEVSLLTAALAYSLMDCEIDVTIVGANSPDQLRECVKSFIAPLSAADFQEIISAIGGGFPISSPYQGRLALNWG